MSMDAASGQGGREPVEAPSGWPAFRRIAAVSAGIAAVVIAFALIVAVFWIAAEAFIILFAGMLLAVLMDAAARGLGRLVGWRRRIRLILVFVVFALLLAGAFSLGGAILAGQANNFIGAMRGLLADLDRFLENGALGLLPPGSDLTQFLPSAGVLFGGATTAASIAMDVVALGAAIPFLGAFFALDPPAYKAIVLSVVPKARRERLDGVLDRCAHNMREWLIGQSVSMVVIFAFSLCALMLVGMPYPALLAVQAGLLTFIPTLGPFVAGVVIILAGLSQSFSMAAYGLGTYILIQFLETHLVTPVVQERTVHMPPAATLGLQIVAGMLFGLLGVVFAVPAAAALATLVEELYVEDCLGGPWRIPRRNERSRLQKWIDGIIGEADD